MNYLNNDFEQLPKLELDKKRFRVKHCPCGKSNKDGKFVPYVGFDDKGYCHSCSETFLPEIEKSEQWQPPQPKAHPQVKIEKKISFIPFDVFKQSLQPNKAAVSIAETNNFIKYLLSTFGEDVTTKLIEKYFIGSSKHWQGANIFWQIDINHKIRTGKIMLYNADTGKRSKEPSNCISWVHTALKSSDYSLKQCFFGEHLLKDKNKPVFVFESEKTAIIASVFFPNIICIAAGGKDGLNKEKCKVLQGRNVTLWADLNAFDLWSKNAKEFGFILSSYLIDKAKHYAKKHCLNLNDVLKSGEDLADFLFYEDWKHLIKSEPEQIQPLEPQRTSTANINEIKDFQQSEQVQSFVVKEKKRKNILQYDSTNNDWNNEVIELEDYFSSIELPTSPIRLNDCTTITDCAKFVESHISAIKYYKESKMILPHLNRLETFLTAIIN